jgi:hypothetical protein
MMNKENENEKIPPPKDLETALEHIFNAATPNKQFVNQLAARLEQEVEGSRKKWFWSDVSTSFWRTASLGAAILALIVVLVWGINNLIPITEPGSGNEESTWLAPVYTTFPSTTLSATSDPGATPTYEPTGTIVNGTEAAPLLINLEPIITAEGMRLRFDSWAPDNTWISYWLGEEEDQPAYLTFTNAETGETCQHEEVRVEDLWRGDLVWQEDGNAIILNNLTGNPLMGIPCEKFTAVEYFAPDPGFDREVSPDGKYLAERVISRFEDQAIHSELRITEIETGESITSVNYIDSPHFVFGGPRWLNNELYLIGTTVDQGVLYFSLANKKVGNLLIDLLELEIHEDEFVSVIGAQVDGDKGDYHLLITRWDDSLGSSLLLYHSEYNQIEVITSYNAASFNGTSGGWSSFSPDGKWLLLYSESPGTGEQDYWLRPVDPPGSPLVMLSGGGVFGGLSQNENMMAFIHSDSIRIASFPDDRMLGRWYAPKYWIDRLWWSPHGDRLVAYGLHKESGHEALFFIEPSEPQVPVVRQTQPSAPSPRTPTETPYPTTTPDLAEMNIQTYQSYSPDGNWVAEGMVASSRSIICCPDYYTRLVVSSVDGSTQYVVVDKWEKSGLGYTTPRPFHWSSDGIYFYYTNEPVVEGCGIFVNGADLYKVDLRDGAVTEVIPSSGLWLSLSADESSLAYIEYGLCGRSGSRQQATLKSNSSAYFQVFTTIPSRTTSLIMGISFKG